MEKMIHSDPGAATRNTTVNVERRTERRFAPRVWSPEQGYDLAAPFYDLWHWQEFWRRNEFPSVLEMVVGSGRYADIGCGTGGYCNELRKLGTPIGIDPSVNMLQLARKNLPPELELRLGSTSQLSLEEGSVDTALTARVLSHEPDLSLAIREIARVTRVGGTWLVTDVHALHPYPCTRIPTPHGDILIRTFKRTPTEIAEKVTASGLFSVEHTAEFFAGDLSWLPTSKEFAKIDQTGKTPVFFIQMFRRV